MYLKLKETSGPLPTSEYELLDGDVPVGKIQIRHKPSHSAGVPPDMASHIYYEIFPEYRGKGYGKKILELGLEEARKTGLEKIVVTCLEENTASRKIIEANGGKLLATGPTSNGTMLKYEIEL